MVVLGGCQNPEVLLMTQPEKHQLVCMPGDICDLAWNLSSLLWKDNLGFTRWAVFFFFLSLIQLNLSQHPKEQRFTRVKVSTEKDIGSIS